MNGPCPWCLGGTMAMKTLYATIQTGASTCRFRVCVEVCQKCGEILWLPGQLSALEVLRVERVFPGYEVREAAK